jgi:hypothetical protein
MIFSKLLLHALLYVTPYGISTRRSLLARPFVVDALVDLTAGFFVDLTVGALVALTVGARRGFIHLCCKSIGCNSKEEGDNKELKGLHIDFGYLNRICTCSSLAKVLDATARRRGEEELGGLHIDFECWRRVNKNVAVQVGCFYRLISKKTMIDLA